MLHASHLDWSWGLGTSQSFPAGQGFSLSSCSTFSQTHLDSPDLRGKRQPADLCARSSILMWALPPSLHVRKEVDPLQKPALLDLLEALLHKSQEAVCKMTTEPTFLPSSLPPRPPLIGSNLQILMLQRRTRQEKPLPSSNGEEKS